MKNFLQYLFDGLGTGSVYALVALGLVIIYRGTGHLNFAHGEMALFCTFLIYQVHAWGLPVGVALLVGMGAGFLIGAGTEVALVRPIARRSQFAVFIVTIALFLGINWLCGALWGIDALPKGTTSGGVTSRAGYPKLIDFKDGNGIDRFLSIGGASWRYKYILVLAVVAAITVVLWILFNKTRLGLAMRAVASNSESSKLVGIKTERVLMFSWGLAVAIGALGGFMVAGLLDQVNSGMMFTVFLYASAAATLGGFDSPGGAVFSGLFLGVVESMASQYQPDWIGSEMKQAVALLIILAVLLFKPSGLFGTSKVERV